jgi:hypothetical protein
MRLGIERALAEGRPVEYRSLKHSWVQRQEPPRPHPAA